MSWNGSVNKGAGIPAPEKKSAKSPSLARGLLAGGAVVLIGIVALYFVTGETEAPVVQGKSVSTIAEVKPEVVVPKTNATVEVKVKPTDPNARPAKIGEVVNGYVMLPGGRIHRRQGVVTNSIAGRPKGKYAIFERSCNNEIACYLTLKPGDILVGNLRYNGRFKQDFVESLREPIIVSETDTPEQAQLKRDVIAARIQLKDAMDRGEDIEKIMMDTRRELQDLMRVKMEYGKLFYEERQRCETDQDVEDLFAACNKMLEQKGVAPLTYGPITKRNLMRQRFNEN